MSICDSGIGIKTFGKKMTIIVPNTHPLVQLSNKLPWEEMYAVVIDDLKKSTAKGLWFRGRKLKVRTHLGAYILQKMFNLKDRETESAIKENAAYQIFCGHGIVTNWKSVDHTKIEKFRSRLSPDTQQKLANLLCKHAVSLGIARADDIDIDSTVQEANLTYPTDPKMLRKLGNIAFTVSAGIKELVSKDSESAIDLNVNLKEIASCARDCFFLSKNASIEEKSSSLTALWNVVATPVMQVISACKTLSSKTIATRKWNTKRAIEQLLNHGEAYLLSSKKFIETGTAEVNKRLSFHLEKVECFNKKKAHKKYEFGRAFQLGRIVGNFIFVTKCTNVRMDDKKSFVSVIEEHENLFGKEKINSVATDKGYYGKNNVKELVKRNINKIGIQTPVKTKNDNIKLSESESKVLRNRRAGIEPLIGHIKQGGQLGKSRMKSDRTTESAGYAAVLGFNLRQMMRALCRQENEHIARF